MMSCSFTWSTGKSWSWCESIVKLWWKLRGSTISSFHRDRRCMSRHSGGAHTGLSAFMNQVGRVPCNFLYPYYTDCRLDASMEEWSILISVTCSVVVTSRALNNLCSPVYFVWSGPVHRLVQSGFWRQPIQEPTWSILSGSYIQLSRSSLLMVLLVVLKFLKAACVLPGMLQNTFEALSSPTTFSKSLVIPRSLCLSEEGCTHVVVSYCAVTCDVVPSLVT